MTFKMFYSPLPFGTDVTDAFNLLSIPFESKQTSKEESSFDIQSFNQQFEHHKKNIVMQEQNIPLQQLHTLQNSTVHQPTPPIVHQTTHPISNTNTNTNTKTKTNTNTNTNTNINTTTNTFPNVDSSFIDKLALKRRDMLKVLTMCMIFLLAIAIHTCTEFWIKELVNAYMLTYRQELGLRILYPIIVVTIIWILKTIMIK